MRKFLSLFAMLLFVSTLAFSQVKVITGRVTDQQGQPIPFATVKVKESKAGTSADADGVFQIKAPASGILVITGTGITQKEVAIGGQTNLVIQITRKE